MDVTYIHDNFAFEFNRKFFIFVCNDKVDLDLHDKLYDKDMNIEYLGHLPSKFGVSPGNFRNYDIQRSLLPNLRNNRQTNCPKSDKNNH